MPYCLNHPQIETSRTCVRCTQPFCDACTVEFLGGLYCGPCRDQRLSEMQGPAVQAAPFAGTGRVDIGRWLTAGWSIIQGDLFTFGIATLLVYVLGSVTCGIALGPLWCGLYIMCYRKMTYGYVAVENLFDGFRRFLWSFLATFLIAAAYYGGSTILQIPLWVMSAIAPDNPLVPLAYMVVLYPVSFALSAFLFGATFFTMPHIAARNANPVEAIQASWEVVRRNLLMFCLTGLLFGIIGQFGMLALCIGILVTTPLAVAANAQAYADHYGIAGYDLI